MPDCWVASAVNYGLGLFAGWWIWGRRLKDLRAAVERHTEDARAVLRGAQIDGSPS